MEEDPPSYLQTTTTSLSNSPHTSTDSHSHSHSHSQRFDHQWRSRLNLPSGMFLLKNLAQGKTLDLLGHKSHQGAPLGVHPIKEPILKGLSLQHSKNNQLFFLDWNGHLYSAAVSRPIDVVDDGLSLAIPQPIQLYPNRVSHPLPRFYLDPKTKTLEILFDHDPDFPPPQHPSSTTMPSFQDYDYLVETVPLKNKNKNKNKGSSRIEGLLEKVTNGFNPFTTTVVVGASRNNSIVSDLKEKRLPRDREASLPPPPIPSKDDHYSPPPPAPPALLSRFTSSPSPRTTPVTRDRFESQSLSSPLSTTTTTPNDDDDDKLSPSPSPSLPSDPQFKVAIHLNNNCVLPPAASEHYNHHFGQKETSIESTYSNDSNTNTNTNRDTDSDSEEDTEHSDDEPSGFRPVRIIKILKSSNWRSFSIDSNNKVNPSEQQELEEEGSSSNTRRRRSSGGETPIGLGFEQMDENKEQRRIRKVEDELNKIEELTAENVWPESIPHHHHLREISFNSNASTYLEEEEEEEEERSQGDKKQKRRRKKKKELKEIRKWRRRQWEAIPVQIEPLPVVDQTSSSSFSSNSWKVQNNDLDQEFYTFQGGGSGDNHNNRYELESEEESEVEEVQNPSTTTTITSKVPMMKRGSIETAKSVVSGVGSFLTSKLLWSVSTSSSPQQVQQSQFFSEQEEDLLPPLPLGMNEMEMKGEEEDAEELKSDELENFGKRNRKKTTTSPPLPELPEQPPLVTALQVPLPDSTPNTPLL